MSPEQREALTAATRAAVVDWNTNWQHGGDVSRHIADSLAPTIDRMLAEAWDAGYSCGLGDYGKRNGETVALNPYRKESE